MGERRTVALDEVPDEPVAQRDLGRHLERDGLERARPRPCQIHHGAPDGWRRVGGGGRTMGVDCEVA